MNKVKEIRIEKNISQRELGKLVGISQPHIKRLENGETKLTVDVAKKIAHALNVSPMDLLFQDLPMSKESQEILEIFENINDEDKRSLLQLARRIASTNK